MLLFLLFVVLCCRGESMIYLTFFLLARQLSFYLFFSFVFFIKNIDTQELKIKIQIFKAKVNVEIKTIKAIIKCSFFSYIYKFFLLKPLSIMPPFFYFTNLIWLRTDLVIFEVIKTKKKAKRLKFGRKYLIYNIFDINNICASFAFVKSIYIYLSLF